ncbi:hypothetical protein PAXRUDRAFT_172614, partial [Paxillus rubicundulus Ve08.2h10]
FLQVLIFNTFIEGMTLPSSIPFSLENSFHMGQHMDMLLFPLSKASSPLSCRNFTCDKFIWWSKQTRPYGTSLPLSCLQGLAVLGLAGLEQVSWRRIMVCGMQKPLMWSGWQGCLVHTAQCTIWSPAGRFPLHHCQEEETKWVDGSDIVG